MEVEAEREHQFADIRSRFDDEFANIDDSVQQGMKELDEEWQALQEAKLPLEFQEELEKSMLIVMIMYLCTVLQN